jgi:hypothetical protein
MNEPMEEKKHQKNFLLKNGGFDNCLPSSLLFIETRPNIVWCVAKNIRTWDIKAKENLGVVIKGACLWIQWHACGFPGTPLRLLFS